MLDCLVLVESGWVLVSLESKRLVQLLVHVALSSFPSPSMQNPRNRFAQTSPAIDIDMQFPTCDNN